LEVAVFLHAPYYGFVDDTFPSVSQLSTAVLWYKEFFFFTKKYLSSLEGKPNKVPLITEGNEKHNKPTSLSRSAVKIHFLLNIQIYQSRDDTE